MDGSAFDSTQHYSIIEAIDNQFFSIWRGRIIQIIRYVLDKENIVSDPVKIAEMCIEQACAMEYEAFFPLDVTAVNPWDSKRFFGKIMPSLSIRGTTYSGHPTRTTLGNTLWSISYYTFLMSEIGIEPRMIAAGDDVCCFIPKERVGEFVQKVRANTHNENISIEKGLGQIVKDVFVTDWW